MRDVEAIKGQVTISEVLEKHGIRTRSASRYRIPCPLHDGRGFNFQVDDDKGLFFCFVCHKGGSVVDLVAHLNSVSIGEAINILSEQSGIREYNPMKIEANKLHDKVEEFKPKEIEVPVPDFETWELEEGYRGLSKNAIKHFGLASCERGVFIPHYGLDGKVIGWAVRQTDPEAKPKYLNNKKYNNNIPFGLYKNQDSIIEKRFVIVVEGQFDSMTLWDNGFTNVVALCGSTLKDAQAHLLLTLTDNMVLMLDGDRAGYLGAATIYEKWKSAFNIQVVYLGYGQDPAELMSKEIS